MLRYDRYRSVEETNTSTSSSASSATIPSLAAPLMQEGRNPALPAGVIAGMTIGLVLLLLCLILLVALVIRKDRSSRAETRMVSAIPPPSTALQEREMGVDGHQDTPPQYIETESRRRTNSASNPLKRIRV